MITQITSDNKNDYLALFQKAMKVLNGDKTEDDADYIKIQSLKDYFGNLGTIWNDSNKNPLYIRLPIDEDLFEINLNTREISIPSIFSKNGVSVKGDEVAETLYFKSARYFDINDLANSDMHIIIQWNNGTENGISLPTAVDVESVPGYIVFGWPLTRHITKNAGKITFAIRFFSVSSDDATEENELGLTGDTLNLSLATKTATIQIKDSLDFKVTESSGTVAYTDLDDAMAKLQARIINSTANSLSEGDLAQNPINLTITDSGWVELTLSNGSYSFDLSEDENLNKIYFSALSQDLGSITYHLKFFTLKDEDYNEDDYIFGDAPGNSSGELYTAADSANYKEPDTSGSLKGNYVETNDVSYNSNKVYYTEENSIYTIITEDEFNTAKSDSTPIYELVYIVTPKSIGKYVVIATNTLGNGNAEDESFKPVIISKPTKAIFSKFTVTNAEKIDSEDYSNYYQFDADSDSVVLAAVFTEVSDQNGDLQWYYKASSDATWSEIDSSTVDSEGFYAARCNVSKNNFNDYTASDILQLRNPAIKPIIANQNGADGWFAADATNDVDLTIVLENQTELAAQGGTVTYQWYKTSSEVTTSTSGATTTRNSPDISDSDVLLEDQTAAKLDISKLTDTDKANFGYYCIVTNTYYAGVANSDHSNVIIFAQG